MVMAASSFTRNKKICQACMTVGHESDCCYIRGPNFRPKELTQHINVFNQQHGDAPPPGTPLPTWNPCSPLPLIDLQ